MNNKVVHQIALSGLFLALGLALPYLTAHAFAVPGTILLPMHLPILLCGLICGPLYGGMLGVILPIVSSLFTGMPAFYPMLPIMAVQLFSMGLISGLMYRRFKFSIYISLVTSMVVGWILYGLMHSILTFTAEGVLRALSVTAAILQGIPGIIIQFILIPIIVATINKYLMRSQSSSRKGNLSSALHLIKKGNTSFVVLRNDKIIHSADGRGVSPILRLYDQDKGKLENSFVVDKIIGKAAAMILVLGKVDEIYGEIMSASACNYLKENNVKFQFGQCADVIVSRDRKGICPIEKSVLEIDDPIEGVARIRETIVFLSRNAG